MKPETRDAVLRGVTGAAEAHGALRVRELCGDGLRSIDVFGCIRELALPLQFEPLDKLLGACLRINSTAVGILITTKRDLHMQRFTAAHELGHFVLEHEDSMDREIRLPGDTRERELPEVEADAFAAEFLMPKWLVKAAASRRTWWDHDQLRDPGVVYQLSLRLAASYEATCWGLAAHDFIKRGAAEALVEITPKELKLRVLGDVALQDSWADVWVLGLRDDGAHLDAGPNDIFVVELEEKAAAGYRWDLGAAQTAGFKLLADGNSFSDRVVGGPSRRRLVFQAPPVGVHKFALQLRRPFESGDALRTMTAFVSATEPRSANEGSQGAMDMVTH